MSQLLSQLSRAVRRFATSGLLGAFSCLALISACESTPTNTPPLESESREIPTPLGPIKSEKVYQQPPSPNLIRVEAPPTVCWSVTFSDPSGNTIGSPHQGSGNDTIEYPPGATKATIGWVECPTEELSVGASSTGTSFTTQAKARKQQSYTFMHTSDPADAMDLMLGEPAMRSCIEVLASSEQQAVVRHEAVLNAGPGAAVPVGVVIHGFDEVTMGLSEAFVHVSTVGALIQFDVTVDGVAVADLASGLNVVQESLSNGWQRATIAVPTAALLPGSEVITRHRAQGGQLVTRTIRF